jgi:ParB family chromosome partitioning protein
MADYRAGAVTLEQLMALTITDDHAAQQAAFYGAPEWQRSPSALRERLTEREIDATHPLVRFAGLDAYTAAGGGIRRDLFAEGDAGTYLTDAALLETLVRGKLDAQAEDMRAEGWAWVEAVPHLSHAERQTFQNAPRHRREPNAREARRIASLQTRLEKIDAELEEAYDAVDEAKTEALEPRREQVADELQAIEEALRDYPPEVRAVAGAIVTLDRNGTAMIHRGLLREAEAKALRTLEKLRQGFTAGEGANDDEGDDTGEVPKTASLSDRLAQRLSVHRTAALQIEVARHPHVALAALVHGMVQTVLQDSHYGHDLPLGVRLTTQDRLESMAPDWPDSPAAVALRELQQVAGEALPQDSAELFAALLAMEQGELVRLLAVCVASTVDVVTPRATQQQPGSELAQAVELDMAAWWKPTAEGFFRHIAKPAILDAVNQYAPAHVTRLAKLKKGDIASEAERLADGTGWMPAVFQTGHDTEPKSVPEAADETDAPEDAADEVEAHELAA